MKNSIQEDGARKDNKPLPKFYYKQKPTEEIDDCIKNFLKKELNHLNQRNENLVAIEEDDENE